MRRTHTEEQKCSSRQTQDHNDNEMLWILMGHIRVGKTSIINKLCNTSLPAGWSASSLTRGLFK